jgi:hypothetical protein
MKDPKRGQLGLKVRNKPELSWEDQTIFYPCAMLLSDLSSLYSKYTSSASPNNFKNKFQLQQLTATWAGYTSKLERLILNAIFMSLQNWCPF